MYLFLIRKDTIFIFTCYEGFTRVLVILTKGDSDYVLLKNGGSFGIGEDRLITGVEERDGGFGRKEYVESCDLVGRQERYLGG